MQSVAARRSLQLLPGVSCLGCKLSPFLCILFRMWCVALKFGEVQQAGSRKSRSACKSRTFCFQGDTKAGADAFGVWVAG